MEGLTSAAGCSAVEVWRWLGDRIGFRGMVAKVSPWHGTGRARSSRYSKKFSSGIWDNPVEHCHTVEWLREIEKQCLVGEKKDKENPKWKAARSAFIACCTE